MRIGNDWVMYDDDEALGLVVVDAELPMPPVVAGASFPGCFAPDTASYDKTLEPVFQDALLRIPPVVTGASFLGSSTPDTTSNIRL